MDVPPSLVGLWFKVGGLTAAVVLPWILGGALSIPRAWRTVCLSLSFSASIAGIVASKKLIHEESYYQARMVASTEAFQSELAYQTAALEQALEAEYLPPEPENVLEPEIEREPTEPAPTKEVRTLEPATNPDRTEPEPEPEPPPIANPLAKEIEPSIRGLVITMRRQSMRQDDIILKVWGVRKGSSKKYEAALAKYKQIVSDAGF